MGGWNDGDDSAFHDLADDAGTRTAFVETLAGFVDDHDLDGADIDWEYPDPGSSADDYALLMGELALAASEGSGIMIWELSVDTLDGTSLPRAIYEAIPDGWTLP